jgi:hypothetical protein
MTIDIAKLRELLAAATPGKWTWDDYAIMAEQSQHDVTVLCSPGGCGPVDCDPANAALICAAVNALPELLDEVERLRAALQEIQDWALNKAPGGSSTFSPAVAASLATICDCALRPDVDAARKERT